MMGEKITNSNLKWLEGNILGLKGLALNYMELEGNN
jgi:hypothetical protein